MARMKTSKDIVRIVKKTIDLNNSVIITKINLEQFDKILKLVRNYGIIYKCKMAGLIKITKKNLEQKYSGGIIGILTGGTSDIPIAEEAKTIAIEMGCEVISEYDVGVAGVHRLFPALKKFIKKDVDVILVVAGMEGALPSVVSGLVDIPIISVPTSIGYGIGDKGIAALMTMLQSCSPGTAVVNIDNGIGAGAIAAMISNRAAQFRKKQSL
jgi:NCAIR mutase (PurE)-related protein